MATPRKGKWKITLCDRRSAEPNWAAAVRGDHIREDEFATFLMFRPFTANSIWIPVKEGDWNWGGYAVFTNNAWTLKAGSGYFSTNPPVFEASGFPTWTNTWTFVISTNWIPE